MAVIPPWDMGFTIDDTPVNEDRGTPVDESNEEDDRLERMGINNTATSDVNTTNPYIEVTGMRHGDIQVSGGLGVSGDLDTSGDLDVSGNLYVETGDTIVSNLNVGTVTATDIHASNIYTNGLNLRHLNDVLRTRIETLEVELQNLKEKYEEMENG